MASTTGKAVRAEVPMSVVPTSVAFRLKGERIEALVDELHERAQPRARQLADELLGLVTELYGAALSRIVELARQKHPALLDDLTGDELVRSLLLVHGLHPESLETRLERALDRARPLLASHGGGVELLELDEGAGFARLRLIGSCDGCPASAVTLRSAVERAIAEEAPEVEVIEVEEARAQDGPVVLVRGDAGREGRQGTREAKYTECPTELAGL